MSDLDHIVSRYLDGELSPDELHRFRRMLDESDEARSALRELIAIRSAARMQPSLRRPSAQTEARLFSRLRVEGMEAAGQRRVMGHSAVQAAGPARHRRIMGRLSAVMVVLLLAVIASEYRPQPEATGITSGSVMPTEIPSMQRRGDGGTDSGATVTVPYAFIIPETPVSYSGARSVTPSLDAAVAQPSQNDMAFVGDEKISDQAPNDDRPHIDRNDSSALDHSPAAAPLLPGVLRHDNDQPIFAAAIRTGMSFINRRDVATAEELRLRVDARLGDNHRLSLHLGRSAAVSETRAERTDIFVSRALQPGEDPAEVLAYLKPVASYEMAIHQEIWAGVGYAYSVGTPLKNVRVDLGGSVGIGEHSWRFGLETPISVRLSPTISIEAAPSFSQIIPHDRSVRQFAISTSSDGRLYLGESERPTFTSVGLELGVRVELP